MVRIFCDIPGLFGEWLAVRIMEVLCLILGPGRCFCESDSWLSQALTSGCLHGILKQVRTAFLLLYLATPSVLSCCLEGSFQRTALFWVINEVNSGNFLHISCPETSLRN